MNMMSTRLTFLVSMAADLPLTSGSFANAHDFTIMKAELTEVTRFKHCMLH